MIEIEIDAAVPRETHFSNTGEQPAVRPVMISREQGFRLGLLDELKKAF